MNNEYQAISSTVLHDSSEILYTHVQDYAKELKFNFTLLYGEVLSLFLLDIILLQLTKKQKGSNNRNKARKAVAKVHEKMF